MSLQQKSGQTRHCYDLLRRQLVHGQLSPGSRLVEEKWASHLGVNRSALREALAILSHEGLLSVGTHGGFFVPELDAASVAQVMEVRLALELGTLQLLEIRGTVPEAGLKQLAETCDLMSRLTAAGFEYGFVEADRKFHDILIDLAENPRLVTTWRHAPLPLTPMAGHDEADRRRNMQQTLSEHLKILEQLRAGDFSAARETLRAHLLVPYQRRAADSRSQDH